MPLNDISFQKGQSGLGRPLPGQDYFSGLVFYTANLPAGFAPNNRIRKFFSITDAQNAGIKNDYNDETPATGSLTVTAIGANGDTITPVIAEPLGVTVQLGTYVKVVGDAAVNAVATGIGAAINANTRKTGYSATVLNAVVTITARKGLGIFLNANAPLSTTIVGTIAATIGAFAGGVASQQAVWWYHIWRFFIRQTNQQGTLYVGFFAVPGGAYNFAEVTTMQQFTGGLLRQIGVYKDAAAYATADLTILMGIKTALDTAKSQLSIMYGADISAMGDLTTIGDLSLLTASGVSDVITQDGAALGAQLFAAYGKSITNLGDLLGSVAAAKVSIDIAWVAKFNISDGGGLENDVIAFGNGSLYKSTTVQAQLSTLNDQRHIFLREFSGKDGSYWNDSHTAIAANSDYAYIEDNRTIDKADRLIYINVLPDLNGPLELNPDGTLSDNAVTILSNDAGLGLDQMVRNSELSGFAITIDPTQNINTAGKLIIAAKLLQQEVARNIQVNVGYTNSLP